jgi:hypothetical protein
MHVRSVVTAYQGHGDDGVVMISPALAAVTVPAASDPIWTVEHRRHSERAMSLPGDENEPTMIIERLSAVRSGPK